VCGIVGIVGCQAVNSQLYDGLTLLQHRGQDAAGIATCDSERLYTHKDIGLVRDVFSEQDMMRLGGNMGIAHCRYPTAGTSDAGEAQPFYVNSPYGIVFAHNGNLTNSDDLQQELFEADLRHINTTSDSEVLLNIFAHELRSRVRRTLLDENDVFESVACVHQRCRGGYAAVGMIVGHGLFAFRDPLGIRPLAIGTRETDSGVEYAVASESVALAGLGFRLLRDVEAGEAVYITMDGKLHSRQCADAPQLSPCIFEFVYLARPDSIIDDISVYKSRLRMGEKLAGKINRLMPDHCNPDPRYQSYQCA